MYFILRQLTKQFDNGSPFQELNFKILFDSEDTLKTTYHNLVVTKITQILNLKPEDKVFVDVSIYVPTVYRSILGFMGQKLISQISGDTLVSFERFHADCKDELNLPDALNDFINNELSGGGIQVTIFYSANEQNLWEYFKRPYCTIVEENTYETFQDLRSSEELTKWE